MARTKYPVTPAIRALRAAGVPYEPHLYEYVPRGGTSQSAAALGVDEHTVVKTLVLEDEAKQAIIALMHGDLEVSTKALARHLGVKTILPCQPAVAERHTGYQTGGTSPFGTRRLLPIYSQQTICELGHIYINGGKRGFLVRVPTQAALELLRATPIALAAG